LCVFDNNIRRQNCIQRNTPLFCRFEVFCYCSKICCEVEGMNSGVGPPCTMNFHCLSGQALDSLFKCIFNGGRVVLNLPSVVAGSFVGQQKQPVLCRRLGRVLRSVCLFCQCTNAGRIITSNTVYFFSIFEQDDVRDSAYSKTCC